MSSIFLPSVGILLLIAHMSNSCFCSGSFRFVFHLGFSFIHFFTLSFSFYKSLSFTFSFSFSYLSLFCSKFATLASTTVCQLNISCQSDIFLCCKNKLQYICPFLKWLQFYLNTRPKDDLIFEGFFWSLVRGTSSTLTSRLVILINQPDVTGSNRSRHFFWKTIWHLQLMMKILTRTDLSKNT